MEDLHFEQLLIREHDLQLQTEQVSLKHRKARSAHEEAKETIVGWSKYIPFLGNADKARLESAAKTVSRLKDELTQLNTELAEVEKQLDVAGLALLRHEANRSYRESEEIKDFYSMARNRVDVFRIQVRDFLKALGQARGAMSTGYDQSKSGYSANAEERLDIAKRVAQKLDIALDDIRQLNEEYNSRSKGTSYSGIEIPTFKRNNYEAGIRKARQLPIAQAQIEFEKTLDYCEELHDIGIDNVIHEIDALEGQHEAIMLEKVRKFWRGKQKSLLNDLKRVAEIREELPFD